MGLLQSNFHTTAKGLHLMNSLKAGNAETQDRTIPE